MDLSSDSLSPIPDQNDRSTNFLHVLYFWRRNVLKYGKLLMVLNRALNYSGLARVTQNFVLNTGNWIRGFWNVSYKLRFYLIKV